MVFPAIELQCIMFRALPFAYLLFLQHVDAATVLDSVSVCVCVLM